MLHNFMAIHVVRHVMPDDRLANVTFWEDGLIVFSYRFGHIHPALVWELDRLSRDISHSGVVQYEPDRRGGKPHVMAWYEAGEGLAVPLHARAGPGDGYGLPPFWEIQVRRDMIDPALVREANEFSLPYGCSVLVPFAESVPT